MANAIASIPVLDEIIKKRYHKTPKGNVQIGAFRSVLKIYEAIKLGVSPNVLCQIASMVDGRIDHQYNPTSSPINPATLRTWLKLTALPKNIGHSTVTKTVAKGCSASNEIEGILLKYNSFGPDILAEIVAAVDTGAGKLISTTESTQGVSDFNAVLATAIAIIDASRAGLLDLKNVLPSEAKQAILDALTHNNNNKHDEQTESGT